MVLMLYSVLHPPRTPAYYDDVLHHKIRSLVCVLEDSRATRLVSSLLLQYRIYPENRLGKAADRAYHQL